jgi:putative chitobiose transport system permease protein
MELAQPLYRRESTITRKSVKKTFENAFWYVVLGLIAFITIFPFLWMFITAVKGPTDLVYSIPPQFIPHDFTFDNFIRVWNQLSVIDFYMNSIIVSCSTVVLNLLITSLAAYPLAKMKFKGRDAIFFILLATFIIPPQLTSIPSFVMAVKVFKYYDSIFALIFPNLATVLNIFIMRQAFKGVPNDLIEAAKIDGAGPLRIWWDILLPVVRPSLATAAIFTFVNQWNDFYWPSLMLHTRSHMTLQVGLVAMQGMMTSDARGVAAGVTMTVIPILIFFAFLQKYFVHGLTGAVKG